MTTETRHAIDELKMEAYRHDYYGGFAYVLHLSQRVRMIAFREDFPDAYGPTYDALVFAGMDHNTN